MIGLGFKPKWKRDEIPWMPKGRYKIMRDYMPKLGTLGLDMMLRTCTVQVNLDFASEADMVKKFRVVLALQPIATALFANSPFTEGKPNGFQSYRSHIWTDTDPDRTRHAAVRVPGRLRLRALCRLCARCADVFRLPRRQVYRRLGPELPRLPAGQTAALPGELPLMTDWADHLTTLFPEVRLKSYLEMRGADGGPWRGLCALPALWVGLALRQSGAGCRLGSGQGLDRRGARSFAARSSAHAAGRGPPWPSAEGPRDGSPANRRRRLSRRARNDRWGDDETHFINTLLEVVETGETPATKLLKCYHGEWKGDIDRVFAEFSY